MANSIEAQKALSAAWDKLTMKLASTQDELRRLEASRGGNWRRQARIAKLREELKSLEKRLDRCQRAMEGGGL